MIATLPTGSLDIVGDVHGEHDALCQVLEASGYNAAGSHPDGRHLVFLGDLVDRGPDSPAVVRLVQSLVEQGRASAILGNHELNLLRGQRKPGNDWFWGERTHHDERYTPWAYAGADDRAALLAFMSRLPLALVRDDLKVVHAAWHGPSVETLAGYPIGTDIGQLFDDLDAAADAELRASGLIDRAAADKARWRHHFGDPEVAMPMPHSVGELDAARHMLNPQRVLTSGVERCTGQPSYASGQWRFAERVRWWDTYADDLPVVVGHYWRQYLPLDRQQLDKGDPDLFAGVAPTAWLGLRERPVPRAGRYCSSAVRQAGFAPVARAVLGVRYWRLA